MNGRGFAGMLLTFGGFGFAGAQDSGPLSTIIGLNGDSIAVDGDGVSVDGSTVAITAAGSYSISGVLADGQLIVDTEDAESVTLLLNGVDITSPTSAPLFIDNAEAVTLTLEAGALVNIRSAGGQNLLTLAPSKTFQSLLVSSPELAKGVTHTLYTGGSASGSEDAGLYSEDKYTVGTEQASFTISSVVTQVGNVRGFGGGMGMPGERPMSTKLSDVGLNPTPAGG